MTRTVVQTLIHVKQLVSFVPGSVSSPDEVLILEKVGKQGKEIKLDMKTWREQIKYVHMGLKGQ